MMRWVAALLLLASQIVLDTPRVAAQSAPTVEEYSVPTGSHPHDVAPAVDGGVWFTAQSAGYLGWLDPSSGEVRQIPLGAPRRDRRPRWRTLDYRWRPERHRAS